ncbi:hypothetical protein V9T40_002851 [Parthenolecanium corni]|uniref:Death-associated protein 1 n=1 Tax=Parthenolecanium corni TaxID=536013 RepID=A0AAN9TGW6_9HEMI
MNSKEGELKAGHPPAVKAGKMRITQHKSCHDTTNTTTPDDASILKVSTSPPNTSIVSGAPVHGHSDYPAEAVQKFHDKPLPTHDQRGHCVRTNIQQPKK